MLTLPFTKPPICTQVTVPLNERGNMRGSRISKLGSNETIDVWFKNRKVWLLQQNFELTEETVVDETGQETGEPENWRTGYDFYPFT